MKKEKDNKTEIVYSYGAETKTLSGKIRFDNKSEDFEVLKIADNDTEKGVSYLLPLVYRIIKKENAPNERQIAIG